MEVLPQLLSNSEKQFLDTFLKEKLVKNYTLDISPAITRGKNLMGNITRIIVNTKSDVDSNQEIILNLILKSAPLNKTVRTIFPVEKIYEREIYLYQQVFPHFAQMEKEKGIKRPFQSLAQCYKTTLNHFEEALILEDLKVSGFQMLDCIEPLDYTHVLLIVKEYGRLHALSYAMRDTQPELFQIFSDNTHDQIFDSFAPTETRLQHLKERSTRALKTLDPIREKEAYQKFVEFQRGMLDYVKKAVRPEPAGQYAVIGHCDGWINNFLFKYDDSTPVEMRFLDWQFGSIGSPAKDLSYFLFACTTAALRHDHFDEFIKEYYQSLSSSLREFGCDPETLLPFHKLQDHLRRFSVYGLYMCTLTLYLSILVDNETVSFNNSKNIEDFYDAIKIRETSRIEDYNCRIRGVILDFVKFGYEFTI